jgi:hypothetical protein
MGVSTKDEERELRVDVVWSIPGAGWVASLNGVVSRARTTQKEAIADVVRRAGFHPISDPLQSG